MNHYKPWVFTLATVLLGSALIAGCLSDPTEPEIPRTYTTIETWSGTGLNGAAPDETPLAEAELSTPMDVAFGPFGTPYIVDWNNHRILEVRDLGGRPQVFTVIGNGTLGAGLDGPVVDDPDTPEEEAGLNHPTNVNFDAQGRIILSAWHNSKIMRCDLRTGLMHRLAGLESQNANGNRCWNGDGMTGIESCLDLPVATAFDSQGYLYISDQKNLRIRRLNPVDGEITSTQSSGDLSRIETMVGTGFEGTDGRGGFNGHGLLGPETHLSAPGGQSAPPSSRILIRDDVLYFCDSENNLVRKLDRDGRVRLVAGNEADLDTLTGRPRAGYDGDGGPATQAHLFFPTDLAFDSLGNLYIADCFNSSIRKVDTNGIITTFAGRGRRNPDPSILGDGGSPAAAWLDRPYGIAIDAHDDVYISDTHHHRIRVVRK